MARSLKSPEHLGLVGGEDFGVHFGDAQFSRNSIDGVLVVSGHQDRPDADPLQVLDGLCCMWPDGILKYQETRNLPMASGHDHRSPEPQPIPDSGVMVRRQPLDGLINEYSRAV